MNLLKKIFGKIKRKALTVFVRTLDFILQKKRNNVVFVVRQDSCFSGNIKAAHDYFLKKHFFNVDLLAHSTSNIDLCEKTYKEKIIKTNSLKGLFALLRSRIIIVEYSSSDWFWRGLAPSKHIYINLWHGIPIKRICLSDENINPKNFVRSWRYFNYTISASLVDRAMMSSSFGMLYQNVWLTGYPRNDWFLIEKEELPQTISLLEEKIFKSKNNRRLILYAPTFRGDPCLKKHENNGVYPFSQTQLKQLKQLLTKHNAILGIRPHLTKSSDDRIPYNNQIIDMSRSQYPDVQILLRNTDLLVSDYSGVWIDYLLLDRPIIGFAHDKDEYMTNRGFLYNYEAIFPGEIVETFDDFISALNTALSLDKKNSSSEKAKFTKNLFHAFSDSNSSERLHSSLMKTIGE